MADLTADAYILTKRGDAYTERVTIDTTAARTIYKGQPIIIDTSVDTTHKMPYVDALVVAADDVFIGIAAEGAEFAIGATETECLLEVYRAPTIVGFISTVFSAGDEGDTVYMSDSGTLSATAADNPQIGIVHDVDATRGIVWVELVDPKICSGA